MKTLIIFFIFSLPTVFAADDLQLQTAVSSSLSKSGSPIEDNFNLKSGLSFSRLFQTSQYIPSNRKNESHSKNTGYGFNTSVGYKWSEWEAMFASDALFGKLNDMTFRVDDTLVRGDGSFRLFTLSPLLRYYTPYTLWNRWSFYTSVGPTWSLHTFMFTNNRGISNFDQKKRISFQNNGGSLNLGLEEIVPYKETHPAYFELGYSYMQSHQVFIVDASDFKDVKTLKKDSSKDFSGHYFIFRFGITLF